MAANACFGCRLIPQENKKNFKNSSCWNSNGSKMTAYNQISFIFIISTPLFVKILIPTLDNYVRKRKYFWHNFIVFKLFTAANIGFIFDAMQEK